MDEEIGKINMLSLTGKWTPGMQWPPQCCVPAFFHAALQAYAIPFAAPAALPAMLGVKVGESDANPLELPIARNGEPRGVTASAAKEQIPRILTDIEAPLVFEHWPLNTIPFGLYTDVVEDSLSWNLVLGVGVDFSLFPNAKVSNSTLHVFRITSKVGNKFYLHDDSHECRPPQLVVSAEELERGMIAAKDGFWIIGPAASLKAIRER